MPIAKHQQSNNNQSPNSNNQTFDFGCWDLEFIWILDIGYWMFNNN